MFFFEEYIKNNFRIFFDDVFCMMKSEEIFTACGAFLFIELDEETQRFEKYLSNIKQECTQEASMFFEGLQSFAVEPSETVFYQCVRKMQIKKAEFCYTDSLREEFIKIFIEKRQAEVLNFLNQQSIQKNKKEKLRVILQKLDRNMILSQRKKKDFYYSFILTEGDEIKLGQIKGYFIKKHLAIKIDLSTTYKIFMNEICKQYLEDEIISP